MVEWVCNSISRLVLYIAADDFFSVVFNGTVVAPQWSGGVLQVSEYDLKQWLVPSSTVLGTQLNTLEIAVLNTGGPGGLLYKLAIEY